MAFKLTGETKEQLANVAVVLGDEPVESVWQADENEVRIVFKQAITVTAGQTLRVNMSH